MERIRPADGSREVHPPAADRPRGREDYPLAERTYETTPPRGELSPGRVVKRTGRPSDRKSKLVWLECERLVKGATVPFEFDFLLILYFGWP